LPNVWCWREIKANTQGWNEMTVNVSRIDEYHNFIRGVVPKPLGQIIEGFYYSLILFDIISVGAQAMYPNIIAQYACAVRPIGSIAWPLFSEDVLL
jgi:hypothetical protein